MSFSRELKDFTEGFKAGTDIRYRRAAAANVEMNLPLFGPEDLPGGACSHQCSRHDRRRQGRRCRHDQGA